MDAAASVFHNPAEHRFEIAVGADLALAAYEQSDRDIRFTHTEVPPALQGRGLAGELARAGLQFAAAQGCTVTPQCSFFAAYMRKHPETRALLSREGVGLVDGMPPL